MASVYEAQHITFDDRTVAIKILDPILSKNVNITDRFIDEAKIIASLDHPNIIKVIDFESKNNVLAIIMEFLNGLELKDAIKQNLLNEEQKTTLFKQILKAVEYGHNRKIIHRDLKPSNIFLTNNHSTVKILDFGIAKMLDSDMQKTVTGTSMGTPMYMSPEQVKGSKEIDERTDIYSLGVLLYFMFSGQTPYDKNDSQYDILTKIVNEPLANLKNNDNINFIIKKATAKNKNERFQNCKEFFDALDNTNELSGFISVNSDIIDKKAKNDKADLLKIKVEQEKTKQNNHSQDELKITEKKNKEKSLSEPEQANIPINKTYSNKTIPQQNKNISNKQKVNNNIVKKPQNYLVFSILATLFLCNPLALIGIFTGAQVDAKFKKGDIDGANKASKNTKTILIVAVILSALLFFIFFIAGFSEEFYY